MILFMTITGLIYAVVTLVVAVYGARSLDKSKTDESGRYSNSVTFSLICLIVYIVSTSLISIWYVLRLVTLALGGS